MRLLRVRDSGTGPDRLQLLSDQECRDAEMVAAVDETGRGPGEGLIVQSRVRNVENSSAIPDAARYPVFVVGCPRSGTTLLRMMLDSHPKLAIPPESHFIPKVWVARDRYMQNGSVVIDRIALDIMRAVRSQGWNLPEEPVWRRLDELSHPAIAEVIEAFFLAYADREGKPRWGDKTPGYSLDMPVIAKLFPTARFVHIIRDGRDVATSIMDNFKDNFKGLTRADATLCWAIRVRKGRAHGRALGPGRYLEVRYEDLVQDPSSVLTSVCKFLDLGYRAEMLEYSKRVYRAVPKEQQAWIHTRLVMPPTQGLRNWREEMSLGDVGFFEALAGRELEQFGYARAVPVPPPSVRMQAMAALAVNGARRAAWKARKAAFTAFRQDELPPARRW